MAVKSRKAREAPAQDVLPTPASEREVDLITPEQEGNGTGAVDKSKASHGALGDEARDRSGIILLVILYFLQGVPVGLAFGTMPYLLKAKMSYSDIGIFMLCTYPYSLKLLWSPLVDSLFISSLRIPLLGNIALGRRKTWIVPMQLIVGVLLWSLGQHVDDLLLPDIPNVYTVTSLFFLLVLFAATQDIAVDGWALTLLSEKSLSYASTAQTVGLNTGYFMSFTVFLAFNSVEFSNKWLRATPLDYPVLSLSAYLKASGAISVAVTLWLLLFKDEDPEKLTEDDLSIKSVYDTIWKITKLPHVRSFVIVHLLAKIGFQANEAVTGLKLVERGFGKEDLALSVLIDFPFQIVLGYLAAKWSQGNNALRPWIWGFVARLAFAIINMGIVYWLPQPVNTPYFLLILVTTVAGSFASTVQFVGISAFHTQIADPLIGGTYMTLLNTVSNLGGTWPRFFVLKAVDFFTISECRVGTALEAASQAVECTTDKGREACNLAGGTCHILRDGYYITSTACVAIGAALLVLYILPVARRLQALPATAWRVKQPSKQM